MPNWVYNSLTIEGTPALIAKVKKQLNQPFQQKHDSYNHTTGKMELVDTLYPNPVFAFHNIYNHIEDGVSDAEYLSQSDHKQPLEEALMFKGNNWYDWNVRHWGTKWDVAVRHDEEYPDTELMEEDETSLAYKFNTAWSPPTPIIQRLSQQYPTLHFNLSYEEETGWGGEYDYLAGEETEIENYENKCRDCDSLNTMEYCENDCGEICSECNYLGEADMDCVAECEVHSELATVN